MIDNYYNKGTKYLEKGNFTKALTFLKKQPEDFKEKFLNIGNCYKALNNDKKALDYYLLANDARVPFADGSYSPAYHQALNNLGLMAYSMGDDVAAMEMYNQALLIDPLYYDAIWNYSNALMCYIFSGGTGSLVEGWKMYEYRFKKNTAIVTENTVSTWDGVTPGDSIVVLTEQGLGDKIMFGRYIHLLREKFSRVVVQCHPSLDMLYSDFEICRSAAGVASVSIPICSLPLVFGTVCNHNWLDGKFTPKEFNHDRPNIGVVWSGSLTHRNNHNRSCPSNYFSDLATFGNLYSLNPTARAAKNVKPCTFKDWGETASFVLGLDLVVTVDTSIVHLCGTLGVPCIMVQPLKEIDFRWGRGSTTFWYPSVRIVKNNNNWDAAFAEVRSILKTQFGLWDEPGVVAMRKYLGDTNIQEMPFRTGIPKETNV